MPTCRRYGFSASSSACGARGLEPLAEHKAHFDAVLHLTTESNRDQSLRYWTPGMTQAPRIEWSRTVAHLLVSHVGARLGRVARQV